MTVGESITNAGHKSRIIVLSASCVFSVVALLVAAWLVIKGVTAEFTILAEFKGWKLYLTSLAPGLLFLVAGTIVMSLAVTKRTTMKTDHGNDKGFTEITN